MKIIHDYFDKHGGGENLVRSIALETNSKIYSAFNTKSNLSKIIVTSKISFILRFSKILTFLYYLFIFKKNFNDLVIFSGNYCCFSISKCKSKKKILYAHSLPKAIFQDLYLDHKDSFKLNFIRRYLIRKYYKNLQCLDSILFNSNKTKLKFLHAFPDLDKKVDLHTLYPFSDINFEKNNYKKKDKIYFVINSRHQNYKNLNHTLVILSEFLKINKNIRLYLTQDGELTDKLIREYGKNSQFVFTGFLDFKEYYNLINKSSGIIFPSRDEDFGISALDAYNLDIPVLVQRSCGFSEILSDKYQYFYNDNTLSVVLKNIISKKFLDKTIYPNKKDFKKIFFKKLDELNA